MTTTESTSSKIARHDVVFLLERSRFGVVNARITRATVVSIRPDGSEVRIDNAAGWFDTRNCFKDLKDAITAGVELVDDVIADAEKSLANAKAERERLAAVLENRASVFIDGRGSVTIIPPGGSS